MGSTAGGRPVARAACRCGHSRSGVSTPSAWFEPAESGDARARLSVDSEPRRERSKPPRVAPRCALLAGAEAGERPVEAPRLLSPRNEPRAAALIARAQLGPQVVTHRTVRDRCVGPGIPGVRFAMGSALGFLPSRARVVAAVSARVVSCAIPARVAPRRLPRVGGGPSVGGRTASEDHQSCREGGASAGTPGGSPHRTTLSPDEPDANLPGPGGCAAGRRTLGGKLRV